MALKRINKELQDLGAFWGGREGGREGGKGEQEEARGRGGKG